MKKKFLRFKTSFLLFLLVGFILTHRKLVLCHQLISTPITHIRSCYQKQLQLSWLLKIQPVLMAYFTFLILVGLLLFETVSGLVFILTRSLTMGALFMSIVLMFL